MSTKHALMAEPDNCPSELADVSLIAPKSKLYRCTDVAILNKMLFLDIRNAEFPTSY